MTFDRQYRIVPESELPDKMDAAVAFTSVCINTALYLPWLASQCLKAGVVIRRGVVDHISQVAELHHSGDRAELVVNCTGLSSLELGGVEDRTLFPARGQITLVRNEPGVIVSCTGTDDGLNELTCIIGPSGWWRMRARWQFCS